MPLKKPEKRSKLSQPAGGSPGTKRQTTKEGPRSPPVCVNTENLSGVMKAVHREIRKHCESKLENYVESNRGQIRPEHFIMPYFEMARIDKSDPLRLIEAQENWLHYFTGIVAEASLQRLEQLHSIEDMISKMFAESSKEKKEYQDFTKTAISTRNSIQAEVR